MRHQTITEGTQVLLKAKPGTMPDETGQPWAFGQGPFTVRTVYYAGGYREPWLRLARTSFSDILPGAFRATVSRLPYDKKITFTIAVADAAGLRPLKPPVRATTLRPPKRRRTGRRTGSKH